MGCRACVDANCQRVSFEGQVLGINPNKITDTYSKQEARGKGSCTHAHIADPLILIRHKRAGADKRVGQTICSGNTYMLDSMRKISAVGSLEERRVKPTMSAGERKAKDVTWLPHATVCIS
eukprot:scaffold193416_cov20-Tisochrysis_lutea.AAC.2